MAPFKLKFRMGSSRSTSQEHDPDPQVNEALLNHHSTTIGASSSTIDSADCTSLGSLGNNERKSLLPTTHQNKTNNLRLGYLNTNRAQQGTASGGASTATAAGVPQTPPPSYEHVLEENTRLANNTFDLCPPQRQASTDNSSLHSRRSSSSLEGYSQCTDPDCLENFANEQQQQQKAAAAAQRQYASNNNEQQQQQRLQRQQQQQQSVTSNTAGQDTQNKQDCCETDANVPHEGGASDDNRKESIDSTELLIATNMTAPSSQDNLLDNCNGDCQNGGQYCSGSSSGGMASGSKENDFCDPLMNHNGYCSNDNHHCTNEGGHCGEQHSQNQAPPDYTDRRSDSDSDDGGGWDNSQMSSNYQQQQQQQQYEQQQYEQQQYQQQQQHYQQQQQQHAQQEQQRSQTPEIISNKSSKEIYKDLAKQWGITCKMSDGCRCMECQSHYFDCEYDDNEHHKTDGGLGAGTPMFISEVMHGTACTIL